MADAMTAEMLESSLQWLTGIYAAPILAFHRHRFSPDNQSDHHETHPRSRLACLDHRPFQSPCPSVFSCYPVLVNMAAGAGTFQCFNEKCTNACTPSAGDFTALLPANNGRRANLGAISGEPWTGQPPMCPWAALEALDVLEEVHQSSLRVNRDWDSNLGGCSVNGDTGS